MIWFHGIVSYLMPNPVFDIYIKYIICQINKVEWLQVWLCITNNSIKHHSFIYTQLNEQTVLFSIFLLSISYLFALSLSVKENP